MTPAPAETVTVQPRSNSAVGWLIALNVAVYFAQLALLNPVDVRGALGFEMRDLDGALWTIGTYMFVHAGFWHLALNMYALWLFGPRVEGEWGSGQFTAYYLLCGFGGWLFHLFFARHGLLIGSSGAVLGVMLAYAARWPTERVVLFGVTPITVPWLVALLTVVILVGGIDANLAMGGTYLTHLGGMVAGWAYLRMSDSMNLDRFRQRVSPVADEPDDMPRAFPRSIPRQRAERDVREVDEIVRQSQAAVAERATSGQPAAATRLTPPGGLSSTDLNFLLDKISAQGLDALTQDERTRLEDAARKLRDR